MTDSHTGPETLEGRLNAHRQVLAALAAAVLSPERDDRDRRTRAAARERLGRLISPDALPADQSEDPGAVPDRAFAIVAATAEELRLIADAVARLRAAGAATDRPAAGAAPDPDPAPAPDPHDG